MKSLQSKSQSRRHTDRGRRILGPEALEYRGADQLLHVCRSVVKVSNYNTKFKTFRDQAENQQLKFR